MMQDTFDVVICGAGIAGVATAYYLGERFGITDVLLVDKHDPLSQTTAKSGENYRNWWHHPAMVDFMNHSLDLMDDIVAETDNFIQKQQRGYVYATASEPISWVRQQIAGVDEQRVGTFRYHPSESKQTAVYTPEDKAARLTGADIVTDSALIQKSFPHFSDEVTAFIHVRRAGSISVQQLGTFLLDKIRERGGKVCLGEVVDVEQSGGRITAVSIATNNGLHRVSTGTFINAAGPFAGSIAQKLHVDLPLKTMFQQKIAFQDVGGVIPRQAPFSIFTDEQFIEWSAEERDFWAGDPEYSWLLKKFPGGVHIKPEGSGTSQWLKLGWAINQTATDPEWQPKTFPEFPELVVRGATKLVPGLALYANKLPQPVVHYGGYYIKVEDDLPLIGRMPVLGSFIVGGLSGFGTMAACAAGELCAQWVVDASRANYADLFSLARAATPTYSHFNDNESGRSEL